MDQIVITLSTKKAKNMLQSIERHGNVGSSVQTIFLIVLNKILGFIFKEEIKFEKLAVRTSFTNALKKDL